MINKKSQYINKSFYTFLVINYISCWYIYLLNILYFLFASCIIFALFEKKKEDIILIKLVCISILFNALNKTNLNNMIILAANTTCSWCYDDVPWHDGIFRVHVEGERCLEIMYVLSVTIISLRVLTNSEPPLCLL